MIWNRFLPLVEVEAGRARRLLSLRPARRRRRRAAGAPLRPRPPWSAQQHGTTPGPDPLDPEGAKFGFDTAENEPCKVCPIERTSSVSHAGAASAPFQVSLDHSGACGGGAARLFVY